MLSSSQGQSNFRGLEVSRPRPRTSKCVLEDVLVAKDVLEDSSSAREHRGTLPFLSRNAPRLKSWSAGCSTSSRYGRTFKKTLQLTAEKSKGIKLHYLIGLVRRYEINSNWQDILCTFFFNDVQEKFYMSDGLVTNDVALETMNEFSPLVRIIWFEAGADSVLDFAFWFRIRRFPDKWVPDKCVPKQMAKWVWNKWLRVCEHAFQFVDALYS